VIDTQRAAAKDDARVRTPLKEKEVTMSNAPTPGVESQNLSARRPVPVRYFPLPEILFRFLRARWPNACGFGWAIVTLRDDVEEVFSRPDIFKVPFAEEIARLNDGQEPGTPFVLGIDNAKKHDAQLIEVMQVFTRSDAVEVGRISNRRAREIIENADGRLDAVSGLITEVTIDICSEYLGVRVDDRTDFAEALMCLSDHLFRLPPIKPKPKVDQKADLVRDVVDDAIRAEHQWPSKDDKTVLARLVRSGKPDNVIRAFIVGLIVGFVPTNTLAGGHILDLLMRRPGFLKESVAAAQAGDDILLGRCLFEALRFKPINCGPFRLCEEDYVVAAHTERKQRIPKGTKVLVCTMSAMFDHSNVEHPYHFLPERPAFDYMHFGFGIHWCVGAFVAQAQLVQTFKPLLLRENLGPASGRAGKLKGWRGASIFPRHLFVEFT
jgi:cytochrome P450